jgi:hypothetical protein
MVLDGRSGAFLKSIMLSDVRENMNGIAKGLLSLAVVAGCLAVIPGAARVGLLILGTAPNPRHPPGDILGEAVGWAIVGAVIGAVGVMIGEAVVMREERGVLAAYRGLILGSVPAIALAAFLGVGLAVIQMDSVDGQAITSVNLGMLAGGVVGALGAVAGVVIGAVLKRVVTAIAP